MSNVKNYYEILGVEESASDEEIKQAFKTLASSVSGPNDPRAEPLREAYGVLRDPEKRAKYDIYLQNNRPSTPTGTVRPVNTGSLSKTPAYAPTPNDDAQKWEYLSLLSTRNYGTIKYYINGEQQTHLKNTRLIIVLNELGGQGWEMTGITTDMKSGAATYIFKRMTDKAPDIIKKKPTS